MTEWPEDATLLIDATMKEELPPLSLPKQEYMERAHKVWEELGLPRLRPQSPWFCAAEGRYLENGGISEKLQRTGLKLKT